MFPSRRRRRDSQQEGASSQVRRADTKLVAPYCIANTAVTLFCCATGAAGFPGGVPGGMPGLGEFLKDPELLLAMNVIQPQSINTHADFSCVT